MQSSGDQPAHDRAAILSIGDELSLGQTLNSNSRWIASRLADAGIITTEHTTLPDDEALMVETLHRLASRVPLVIVTGGLGPTLDDLTRTALAQALGEPLVEDPLALAQVESWFTARGRPMPAINRVQALRPASTTSLANLHGTAPGLFARIGNADCFCLPGPPREMMPMFDAQVLPRLRPPTGTTVATRVLHTYGMGESDIATRLGVLMDRDRASGPGGGVLAGTTASGGVVSVRLRYEGPLSPYEAGEELERMMREVRLKCGAYIFGTAEDTLAGTVVGLLRERGERVGVVESCTGGLLGADITDVAGASQVFSAGLITYANTAKQSLAGVDSALLTPGGPGAVSRETALAMAVGGLDRLGAEHCLAVSGIAGPGGAVSAQGDRPAKPVGTVYIARCSRRGHAGTPSKDIRHFQFVGDRAAIREGAVKAALAMLRLHLIGAEELKLLRQVSDRPTPVP